jgi:hypothetical protein
MCVLLGCNFASSDTGSSNATRGRFICDADYKYATNGRRRRDLLRICRAQRPGEGAFIHHSFGDFHHVNADWAALAAMVNEGYKPTRFRDGFIGLPSATRQRTT